MMTEAFRDRGWHESADEVFERPAWHAQAACHGRTDAFFADQGVSAAAARLLCRTCPVRDACLDYALDAPAALQGIWAGYTAKERQILRGQRAS